MGNVEAAVVRNVDKRTSRREHRPTFLSAVHRFRAAPFAAPSALDSAHARAMADGAAVVPHSVKVCVRKRPMFPHEAEQGEFDVVTCLPRRIVVHDARMHPDMVHMYMNHHDFAFDEAFTEAADNDEVYARTAHQLVRRAVDSGSATVMMYGQTGSGKTYTMSAIYQRVARDLFEGCDTRSVFVSFIELSGDAAFDMLNQGATLTLNTAGDGSCHAYPCVEVGVQSEPELCALIDMATKMRATAATGVHDQSSRSHAICRIFVDGSDGTEGCLTLVDLAGSEHRIDSMEHNAERRKEGAKINASLCALKECIRAMAAGAKFIAFRQSKLTQLLRNCFDGQGRHSTVVIATVSPSSKDTEHSLNTLRHACIMDGQGEKKTKGSEHVAGGIVTKERLGEIDVTRIARDRRERRKSEGGQDPAHEWGRLGPPTHQAKKSNTGARAALDRRCLQALPPNLRQGLLQARGEFGTQRQRARLHRPPLVDTLQEPLIEETAQSDVEAYSHEQQDILTTQPGYGNATREIVRDVLSVGMDCSCEASIVSAERVRALDLFRIFCKFGRKAREWTQDDLRLISAYVVPVLFGESNIEWQHPKVALDELEKLLSEMPPPSNFTQQNKNCNEPRCESLADDSDGVEDLNGTCRSHSTSITTPQRRPSGGEATYFKKPLARLASKSDVTANTTVRENSWPVSSSPAASAPTERTRTMSAGLRQPPVLGGRAPATAHDGLPRSAPTRESQQARAQFFDDDRCGSSASSPTAAPVPADMSGNAVRARREKMDEARKKALQEALGKKMAVHASRADEIADLQAQLESGNCSAAAAVGLKKRIAALRAATLREERAAAQRQARSPRTGQPEATPVVAIEAEQARVPHDSYEFIRSRQEIDEPRQDRELQHDQLPKPAVPPPREASRMYSGGAGIKQELGASMASPEESDTRFAFAHGRSRAAPVRCAAATAPWANEYSNEMNTS